MKQAYMAFIALLALSGCNSAPVRIVDFEDQPVRRLSGQSISMDEVQIDVRMAAGKAGWNVIPGEAPGHVTATRIVGESTATVAIFYDLNKYSIKYQDSTGLDFMNGCTGKAGDGPVRTGSKCIKPVYNEWVQELNNALAWKLQY